MRIGRLDRRVSIQRVTYTTSDLGVRTATWVEIGKRWARVDNRGGKEADINDSSYPTRTTDFTIRYDAGIGPDDRVVWDGRVYEIESVEEIHYSRDRWMKLRSVLKGLQDG